MLSSLLDSYPFHRFAEALERRQENRVSEFGMLAQAFEFVKTNGIEGDYFEFGLWRGKTFAWARLMARRYRVGGVVFRGFDSFCGLPEPKEQRYNIWNKGQFACNRHDFERLLAKKGFLSSEYALTEGFYDKSLTPSLSAELMSLGVKAAVIYIDCDLYESTRDVLLFMRPFLQDGTVLCFDDYFAFRGRTDMGEQRALREFQAVNADVILTPYVVFGSLGHSFLCHLRPPDAKPRH
jgi:O-methyltransferase